MAVGGMANVLPYCANHPLAERWDGARWSIAQAPCDPNIYAFTDTGFLATSCSSETSCVALGTYGLEDVEGEFLFGGRWDGRAWTLTEVDSHGLVSALTDMS